MFHSVGRSKLCISTLWFCYKMHLPSIWQFTSQFPYPALLLTMWYVVLGCMRHLNLTSPLWLSLFFEMSHIFRTPQLPYLLLSLFQAGILPVISSSMPLISSFSEILFIQHSDLWTLMNLTTVNEKKKTGHTKCLRHEIRLLGKCRVVLYQWVPFHSDK